MAALVPLAAPRGGVEEGAREGASLARLGMASGVTARGFSRSVARNAEGCPHTAGRRGIVDPRDVRRNVR